MGGSVRSHLEATLLFQCKALGLPAPVREHYFHSVREWRLDFYWPEAGLAAEVDGGSKNYGRHNRPEGFQTDVDKSNAAQLAGLVYLRFTGDDVRSGWAVELISRVLAGKQDGDLWTVKPETLDKRRRPRQRHSA